MYTVLLPIMCVRYITVLYHVDLQMPANSGWTFCTVLAVITNLTLFPPSLSSPLSLFLSLSLSALTWHSITSQTRKLATLQTYGKVNSYRRHHHVSTSQQVALFSRVPPALRRSQKVPAGRLAGPQYSKYLPTFSPRGVRFGAASLCHGENPKE